MFCGNVLFCVRTMVSLPFKWKRQTSLPESLKREMKYDFASSHVIVYNVQQPSRIIMMLVQRKAKDVYCWNFAPRTVFLIDLSSYCHCSDTMWPIPKHSCQQNIYSIGREWENIYCINCYNFIPLAQVFQIGYRWMEAFEQINITWNEVFFICYS